VETQQSQFIKITSHHSLYFFFLQFSDIICVGE